MKRIKSKKVLMIGGAAILSLLSIGLYFALNDGPNYAQEVARPLQKSLADAGVVEVCSLGDAGRGPDNIEPWYAVYFRSSLGADQAKALAKSAAKANGFNLQEASAGTKGYLGSDVFTDAQTKDSPYGSLKKGKISVAVAFTSDGVLHACSPTEISTDSEHTAIVLEVRLPQSN